MWNCLSVFLLYYSNCMFYRLCFVFELPDLYSTLVNIGLFLNVLYIYLVSLYFFPTHYSAVLRHFYLISFICFNHIFLYIILIVSIE